MTDFSHAWNHISDFVVQHLVPFLEDAADEAGDAADGAADEIAHTAKSIAEEHAKAADALVAKKTGHAIAISAYFFIPLALIVGAFVIKLIYGLFTEAADKVGKGLSTTASKLTSVISGSEEETAMAGASDQERHEKHRLLFGEILKRYVNPSLSDEEVNKALEEQRASRRNDRLGEILLEKNQIIKSDVVKALKIQGKSPHSHS